MDAQTCCVSWCTTTRPNNQSVSVYGHAWLGVYIYIYIETVLHWRLDIFRVKLIDFHCFSMNPLSFIKKFVTWHSGLKTNQLRALDAAQAQPEMESKTERCQIWRNVAWNWPFGILNEHVPSYPSRSRNDVQKRAVPDLHQCVLELNIWSTERARSKVPKQIQK